MLCCYMNTIRRLIIYNAILENDSDACDPIHLKTTRYRVWVIQEGAFHQLLKPDRLMRVNFARAITYTKPLQPGTIYTKVCARGEMFCEPGTGSKAS